MSNKPSKLRPLILDRHVREMKGNKIAEELGCSTSTVSMYISDFKTMTAAVEKNRVECKNRQNTSDPKIRKKCTEHKTCETCDCRRKKPIPII